jgi:argininosuccinate lyase
VPLSSSLGSTGRIKRPLTKVARKILFERELADQLNEDLPVICRVDLAHILMLAEQRIINPANAARLLRAIRRLMEDDFRPLRERTSFRGLFLMYENYLIETQGGEIGGLLQTARSRNDLNAAVFRVKLRAIFAQAARSLLRCQATVISRARKYAGTVMPAYTHGQPAEPITYGHYLSGVAQAMQRDIHFLLHAAADIEASPLGAGAIAGTSVPINTLRTAHLLGFKRVVANSIDAVASRDLALRVLAALSIAAITLSRAATDLLQWLADEFQFLVLPDELVGSSSLMPQKRNPFLLEHVQGRTASAMAAFTHGITATRNVPFTNNISVGTESLRPLESAAGDIADAATLLRLVIAGATPVPARMLLRASQGFTNASAVALRLVMESGTDFRSAHHQVGAAISGAIDCGMNSLHEFAQAHPETIPPRVADLGPVECVANAKFGGGPAPEVLHMGLNCLRQSWLSHQRTIRAWAADWEQAEVNLFYSVNQFCREMLH